MVANPPRYNCTPPNPAIDRCAKAGLGIKEGQGADL